MFLVKVVGLVLLFTPVKANCLRNAPAQMVIFGGVFVETIKRKDKDTPSLAISAFLFWFASSNTFVNF